MTRAVLASASEEVTRERGRAHGDIGDEDSPDADEVAQDEARGEGDEEAEESLGVDVTSTVRGHGAWRG